MHVLHGDEVVRRLIAFLVHPRDEPARFGELHLQARTAPFGLEDLARLAVLSDGHELESDLARMSRVIGQKHRRHPAAANLAHNLVRTHPLKNRRHRRPRPGRAGAAGCSTGGLTNQLSRRMSARLIPGPTTESTLTPRNVFAMIAGRAEASTSTV